MKWTRSGFLGFGREAKKKLLGFSEKRQEGTGVKQELVHLRDGRKEMKPLARMRSSLSSTFRWRRGSSSGAVVKNNRVSCRAGKVQMRF